MRCPLASILSSNDAILDAGESPVMRTTVVIDDELLDQATEYTGLTERSAIIRAALKALVEREAARRLARMGGTSPDLEPIPRRRTS